MPSRNVGRAPVGRDPGQWVTVAGCKRVLIVVHTLVYGQRLQDILALLGADLRVHVIFTVAPHAFNHGVDSFLRSLGGTVLPWEEAIRTEFDLALAAGSQGIDRIRGPLVRIPHGAGHIKLSRPVDGVERSVGGLGRDYLMSDGRVVPVSYALAHRRDLDELGRHCPEALPVADVVGDSSYDRIAVSLPRREQYRRALGLRQGERLVLVSSTWGLGSSFNRLDALLPRLVAELPRRRLRSALLIHPNVWAGHGNWQVESWLTEARAAGVRIIPPEQDWRALLIAADYLIGDHGSVTLYGTMTRAPILLARYPLGDVNPHSPGALLARTAPSLVPGRPLAEQLAYAESRYEHADYAPIAARISSEPGRFNRRFRRLLYGVLGLGEPAREPVTEPVPLPRPLARGRR